MSANVQMNDVVEAALKRRNRKSIGGKSMLGLVAAWSWQ
jgi:hypothetical protein